MGSGRRTRSRFSLILACAAAWAAPSFPAAAQVFHTSVTVRVYQTAGLPRALEQRALAETQTLLRAALVDVRWMHCTGPHPAQACQTPPGPSERVLAVRKGSPCEGGSITLGNALVVQHSGGVFASVDVSCVAWLAKTARTDVAVLLGRVMAHELGHLMMHTSAHAPRGLMRPIWTANEIRRNRAADWMFTARDAAAMRLPGPES